MKNDECKFKFTPEWVTAFIALIALIVAAAQIYYSNNSQKNNTAIETYREYVKLAMDNSKYSYGYQYFDTIEDFSASGKLNILCSKNDSNSDCEKEQLNDFSENNKKYEWYVSFFLNAAEQIFAAQKNDVKWRNTLIQQFCYHESYLKSKDWENMQDGYDGDFVLFQRYALQNCGK